LRSKRDAEDSLKSLTDRRIAKTEMAVADDQQSAGGYEHQIDSRLIAARLESLSFSDHFFIQLLLGQGIMVLLLVCVALKRLRYATYLFAGATTMAIVALATGTGPSLRQGRDCGCE
jgi:hypothetical protein